MRFIHVGVGGFGQCWVRALKDNKNAKVVGLVDVKDEALRKACEIGGYSKDLRFKSLEEALKNLKADAVAAGAASARCGDGHECGAGRHQRETHGRHHGFVQGHGKGRGGDRANLCRLAELPLFAPHVDAGQRYAVRQTGRDRTGEA